MFHKTRLKLTALYILTTLLISVTFSIGLYSMMVREVTRFDKAQRFRIERQIVGTAPSHPLPETSELIEESKGRIVIFLIIINATVVLLAGGCGYFLAGRSLEPIEEMVREQNRFISDASHELRTPITALKSAFEVYRRSKKKTQKEASAIIDDSLLEVDALQNLTESLLELVQYNKPNKTTQMGRLDLVDIFKDALRRVKPLAQKSQIKIKTDITPVTVQGNGQALKDLVVILLDNAIKYSSQKTTITIHVKKVQNNAVMSISDRGIGMDQNDLPHIFERFYRADTARTKRNTEGYGLGLAIASEIVQTHNGTIQVSSEIKKGTTFTVTIPCIQTTMRKKSNIFS
ncbi:MAG: HAMP domain-containing histidine kinase [Candidatus Roizmanbacteria bacterium]|nr:HAMP domain-containing histidine kinase [Candidatus Roizmanbacteria bacterium]